jgi:hypothetical protein
MGMQSASKNGKKVRNDPALSNSFQSKTFESTAFSSKKFEAATFQGTKSAELKTFETHSFFGIKNPWFGRKIFETGKSSLAGREASESSREYSAGAFSVKEYGDTKKEALTDTVLPTSATPHKYLGAEQRDKRDGIDKFTQNLSKDLSIDDVRDLLNKGKGE